MSTFGMRLRLARKNMRITLLDVARRLSVSKPTVWAWEKDRAKPTEEHMAGLTQLFGDALDPPVTHAIGERRIPVFLPGERFSIYGSLAEAAFSTPDSSKLLRESAKLHARRLNDLTEHFCRKAIEAGPGFNVWRGGPYFAESDPGFNARYEFKLVAPGSDEVLDQPGVMLLQPELTEGERARLLADRFDWRETSWQDHCGVPECGHSCCEAFWGEVEGTKL